MFFNNKDKRPQFLLNIIYKLDNNTDNKGVRVKIVSITINSSYKKLLKNIKDFKINIA